MDCPRCGYVMTDLETECRRCQWKHGDPLPPKASPVAPVPAAPRAVPDMRRPTGRYEAPPARPVALTVMIIITWVGCGLGLLGAVFAILAGGAITASMGHASVMGGFVLVFALLLASLLLGEIVVAYFLWQGASWARWTFMILLVLGLVGSIYNLRHGFNVLLAGQIAWAALFLVILNLEDTKAYCRG